MNISYSILPHPQESRQCLWILQVRSVLLLPLSGQVLGSGSEYPTDLLDVGRDEGMGLEGMRKSQFYQVEPIH